MTIRTIATAAMAASLSIGLAAAAGPEVGDVAKDFTLKDLAGGDVTLSAMAGKGPVVLIVLRGWPGYQCPLCTAQVADLAGKAEALRAAGASVLLVYPGPADALKAHADEFVGGKSLPEGFTMVIDPDYAFTKAYDLRWDAPKETAYPSTFVLDGSRKVVYAKVSKAHGGRSKAADVVAAVAKAR